MVVTDGQLIDSDPQTVNDGSMISDNISSLKRAIQSYSPYGGRSENDTIGIKMKFNINEFVKIRMTVLGHTVYRQHRDEIAKNVLKYGIQPDIVDRHPEDASGWSRWQLWEVMAIFGRHLYMGGPLLFETKVDLEIPAEKE